jgi:hypothetical protein
VIVTLRRVADPKIVITGVGRSGTTLLVEVLTELGFDTGVGTDKVVPYLPKVRAGLECPVDAPDAPTVVKDLTLGFRMREVLERNDVDIAHVIIPTRRLDVALASRIRAANYGHRPFRRGALTGTMLATEQQEVLERMRDEIVGALDDFGVPYSLLEFPRYTSDAAYTHATLAPVLGDITVDDVQDALERCVRPDRIHEQPLSRQERVRMVAVTLWMRLYRLPLARYRNWRDPEGSEARLRAGYRAALEREAAEAQAESAAADCTPK